MKDDSNDKPGNDRKRPKSPYSLFPKPLRKVKHGLYMALERHDIDGRTRLAQVLRRATELLLEGHKEPAPGPAQLLAQRCAVKLIRAASYEAALLGGKVELGAGTEKDYLMLCNSIRADIMAMSALAKDGQLPEKAPSLQEYLDALKSGQIVSVEAVGQGKGE
ncbi:MAG: hypothetical protein WBV23_11625 [Desulfobaccales bacterium]